MLTLGKDEADAFYAKRSNWQFLLDDGREGSVAIANQPITFELTVTAHKESASETAETLLGLFV